MDSKLCIKSKYKLFCEGCNSNILPGQLITQVNEGRGMELRCVVLKNGFYTPFSGARWVHRDCNIYEYCEEYGMEICLWTDWAADQYTKLLNQD